MKTLQPGRLPPRGWEFVPNLPGYIREKASPLPKEDKQDDETMHIVKVVSLPGPAGKDGANGKDGKAGKDGRNGIDGKDGKDGRNGIDGKNGKDGKPGPKGLDGKAGKDGKDGRDGEDARGIKAIKSYGSDMEIELTDGTKTRHKLATGGGTPFGGSSQAPSMSVSSSDGSLVVASGATNTDIKVATDIDPVFTYSSGVLTGVAYAGGKTKTLTYTSGVLTQLDYFNGLITKRKTFNYTSGQLTSITEAVI